MTQAMHQVLIIEDEPAIRSVLRVLLESEGYRCVEADTAMRAEIEAHMALYPDRHSAALPALAAAQRLHGW